eukprot:378372_1
MAPDSLPSFRFLSDVEGVKLRKAYEDAGQGHVFQFADAMKCTESETAELVAQLRSVDLPRLNDLLRSGVLLEDDVHDAAYSLSPNTAGQPGEDSLAPLPCITPSSAVCNNHRELGISAIKSGHVAAVTMAGGQGTRLGSTGPKGMYDIGLPSGKSLFQLMAERLKCLARITAANKSDNESEVLDIVHIPWYIMTSPLNNSETMQFFMENRFFGLPEGSVKFFQQQTLPCLSPEGKLILEGPGKVAMAPDGNGGVYSAMETNGILKDMIKKGVKYLHIFGVDNALIKPVDPVFVGHCISQNAECGNKCVQKTSPDEKVGIYARKNGKTCVIEYSEVPQKLRDLRDDSHDNLDNPGRLVFGAANICSHFITLEFIVNKVIPFVSSGRFYHVARKKIPVATGPNGVTVTPSEPNGIKLESFIFDVFSFANIVTMVEVTREDEFAPVKNATGLDSPETARALLYSQARRWLKAVGAEVIAREGCCEVSPLVSYGGEGMERFRGKKVESVS